MRKAIKTLEKHQKFILDDVRYWNRLSQYYGENNMLPKALVCEDKLIEINPNDEANYLKVLKYNGIDFSNPDKAIECLELYLNARPKVNKPLRVLVNHLPAKHPRFKEFLTKYMKPQVIKGVPSMINDLKVFYKTDEEKAVIIGEMLSSFLSQMEKDMHLEEGDEEEHDPTVQLWLYYFLSQHHMRTADRNKKGYELAFEFIQKAICHTPTVIELYIHKAKLM